MMRGSRGIWYCNRPVLDRFSGGLPVAEVGAAHMHFAVGADDGFYRRARVDIRYETANK